MNSVRIIGGNWRRRVLNFPDSEGLRPTPDRVRETLFNWLGQDLTGLNCLDLFAGSGALGFEAASRGASKVLMVDTSPKVIAALQANARILDTEGHLQIVRGDAVKFASSLQASGSRFDVVFLDPPYKQGWIDRLSPWLPGLLTENGQLYVEAEFEITACGGLTTVRNGRAGQVYYHLMQKGGADGAE
jgi:16S rRNA (guanine966-N2)-methyltransferase